MRHVAVYSLVAAIAFTLAGCVPEAENSLSKIDDAKQDTRLHGVWKSMAPGNSLYLHVGAEPTKPADPTRPNGQVEAALMKLYLMGHDKTNQQLSEPLPMRFFVTQVGNAYYANALLPFENAPSGDGKPPRYWFLKYEVNGDDMRFQGIDMQATATAIERGDIKGTVLREGTNLKQVTITASGEELVSYLAKGGDKVLFPQPTDKMTQFHRVGS